MTKRHQLFDQRWIASSIALISGGLAGLLSYGHLIARFAQHGKVVILGSFVIAALLVYLSFLALTWLIIPRLATFQRNHRIVWLIGALLASLLLVLVIPLPIPVIARSHTLTLRLTAQPGSVASGGEVWAIRLQNSSGTSVALADSTAPDWAVREDLLVSPRRKPDPLIWNGSMVGDLRVSFVTHPPTGHVQLIWDEQAQELDLDAFSQQPPVTVLPATLAGSSLLALLYAIATVICLALLSLAFGLFFTQPNPSIAPPQPIGPWWLLGSLLCLVCWSVYLVAFWPGIMSADSLAQWQQAMQGRFDDWHPAFHSMLIWLLIRIWPSPAAVALTQIVVLALVVGLAIREAVAWGVPRRVCLLLALIYSFSPVNGMLTITLWKDILYSTLLLALFTLLLAFVRTRAAVLHNSVVVLALVVTSTCLALFRHNGILVGVPVLLLLFLVARRSFRRPALIALVSCLALIGLVRYGLYPALGVTPTPEVLKYNSFAYQMSAYIHNGVVLSATDQEVVSRIQPMESWRDNYVCYTINPTFFNGKFDLRTYEDTIPAFLPIWWRTTLAHSDVLLAHETCITAMIWRISPYPNTTIYATSTGIDPNPFGLVQQPIWPEANTVLNRLFAWTLQPRQVWLVWYPALYFYASLASLILLAIRMRNWLYLLPLAPTVINTGSWMLLATAHDFRYQYGVYLIAPIAVALITARSYTSDR